MNFSLGWPVDRLNLVELPQAITIVAATVLIGFALFPERSYCSPQIGIVVPVVVVKSDGVGDCAPTPPVVKCYGLRFTCHTMIEASISVLGISSACAPALRQAASSLANTGVGPAMISSISPAC